MSVLYHGGIPDLKPGDTIEPGHSRDNYDDCPICRARREKGADAIEGTGHPEQVYCTRYRDYAAFYASMYGKGDVYQVRPVGDLIESDEDFDGCYRCDRLVVVRAVERHVTLTPKRRRKVIRLMQRLGGGICLNPLPRNATPEMIERWAAREYADMRHIMREAERSIK
ncbi:hypothetical protein [Bifidobacterium pseudocatenulatum]|uniref:hypothetical protein n=1 Tax=Bifidobacterium pseudocatenulatum TaxID=28026 RepID=UPI0034A4CD9F